MTTKALTRCYRFETVDFEPDLRLLVWQDNTETELTVHESRLLETLCYFAGEVICAQSLFDKTFTQLDPYDNENNNHFDLNTLLISLTQKLENNGSMSIPIEVIPNFGFRVPLPDKTCRLVHTFNKQPRLSVDSAPEQKLESATEHIVKYSLLHKISVLLLAAAGVAIVIVSNF
ncbi:helix-turn-helix domain-containing protein [Photobacterium chitinilyticum]|uniref:Winged helix family transcriptional regulator n=1 Tax=Photobacterium chitinilyticum TaxID=2485123 RepID=A0A3S3QUN4_9GAMM|nr:helix-turn-helix domain-containing protein [Photobacterium chitinilyticum]RWX57198.1 winged helix family transcriptional regulator [Photobacterium chitinilyticum]